MLLANPKHPKITTSMGFDTSNREGNEHATLPIQQGRRTWHIYEALNSLHEDAKTKGEKESGVDECSKYFCTMPAVGIGSGGILSCKLVEHALRSSSVKS